mmetsp:Transcript_21498/g.46712  ORF Transcript_21498/g.46712 Transcript_21498/m.46712 type:complete len:611 (+) Transcript_21498:140-1972(+)|eukprot:CAMPEP_0172326442 /NCGR_PEP_ID=MMETSP1058-20130122/56540_1 /TAXON_ID=83371 /ORGANISM="Detonula confervacea, Strain CCMP 353" /LENGTH=610 /DNA_ID=CAMNT_0013043225 /DNA_START=135 /DNA_END=1967 /DNA_ORIENTATION=-
MSLRELIAPHPYQQLRQIASPSYFHECISPTTASSCTSDDENNDGDADHEVKIVSFRSKLEEAIDYCIHRTSTMSHFAPTRNDTFAHWLVDWEPIIRMIQWEDLFWDHDNSSVNIMGDAAGRNQIPRDGCDGVSLMDSFSVPNRDHCNHASALREVCITIQNIVWTEHRNRLYQLTQYYQVHHHPLLKQEEDTPGITQIYWDSMINQFHDCQLRSLQKIFLDLWTEINNSTTLGRCYYDDNTGAIALATKKWHEKNDPLLKQSDVFMFRFISDQLTIPFLQSSGSVSSQSATPTATTTNATAIWINLIQQYTQSLIHDIQSLIHPSRLNPIAAILSSETKVVKRHDLHTRITMLRFLLSKIRRWAELLVGLQRERRILVDDELTLGKEDKMELVSSSEDQDIISVATSDALTSLLGILKSAGALNLLTLKDQQVMISTNSSPLGIIRLIDEYLQLNNNSSMQTEPTTVEKIPCQKTTVKEEQNKKLSENQTHKPPCTPFHMKIAMPPKVTSSSSVLCIIKKCRNIGKLSDNGMCKHHINQSNQPHHPFRWADEISHVMGKQIMKRLRRRGIGLEDNIQGVIIKEIQHMQQRKATRANNSRKKPPPTMDIL